MIEELQPYADYKESGLAWLETIPRHWRTARNGILFQQRNDTRFPDLPILEVSLRTGVRIREFSSSKRKQVMADASKYKRACAGDVAYNMMRMWQGAVGVAPVDGLVSPAYVVARPFPGTQSHYYTALFKSELYMGEIDAASRGIVKDRNRLYWAQFKQMQSLAPPPDEQAAIVRFLDHANRKIDSVVRAKRKLIGLLNEQKQVIIHRAVIRGLDPNVKFKPSGIPWLGDVPEHWEVIRFKQRVHFQEGPGIMAADFKDAGVPLLRISCLLSKTNGLFGCNYLDPRKAALKWSHFAIQPGDYILNASTSASTILMRKASEEMYGAIPYTGLIRLWPKSDMVDMGYLCLLFESRLLQDQFLLFRSGVGIAHFGPSHLKKLWVLLPPKSEQHFIISKLKAGTASLDHAISCTEHEIELLREYRTTLTAEVVTGKLDVREVVKRLPEEAVETLPPDDSVDQLIQDEIGEEIDA